jgi:16S rRNA (guanine527-N7)-methyltransferase
MLESRITELFPNEKNEILDLFYWDRVEKFYAFLLDKNEEGGFFSKNDTPLVLDRHIMESIYHVYQIQKFKSVSRETNLCDAGTGPGLPGFLFHCLKSHLKVTLLDSQKRKLQHVENFSKEIKSPKSLSFLYARMEDVKKTFDIVIMRSAIPYPWSVEMCSQLVKTGGTFIPFLGKKNQHKEIEEEILHEFGFRLEKEIDLPALQFLGERSVKFLKKVESRKDSFPRQWSVIQKEIRKING